MNQPKNKLVRITTIPASMLVLLKGQLSFMQEQGFDVYAVSSDGEEVEALKKQEHVRHFVVPMTRLISPLQDLKCIMQLTKFLKKEKPQIVHTHTPKAGLIGMWSAWLAGVPVRMHTIAGIAWIETTGIKRFILKQVERLTALAATGVYPNSHKQMEFLQSEGIAGKKFKVLGNGSSNGIDTQYISVTPALQEEGNLIRQREGIDENACVWIFIGRIVKDKGIEELLFAWEKISSLFPHDRLWLLGLEEPELDPLSQKAYGILKDNPTVKQWGFIKDIRPFLSAAQVLVFPSYREGFPNVPMQAGAMGCALILSDINGCNEIVENETSGLLVPAKNNEALYEAMSRLRKDDALRKKLSAASRKRIVENFDRNFIWHLILKEYTHQLSLKNLNHV
jgi:glycosyltransferase involved in cell wall biosynthesis